ncbi:SDR family NAD(P)-dependent oxidoreductase [Alpinimonas psychrophila]|uniref:Cyclic-di-GMP-binding biofilm dispersal mediator protein n=1 Tax=Alpinimonas psychrophila TaxID=748908 RepID=A0A7W3JTM5_9MICO|nr:SDR family NAD(P)-dependent oxidoreductase [Alpinimonas psychrophila]MBA8829046.1 cyclic-di-GMP-binding biofilm dispersal mediator protein [Alpinimonas psychrophila]
MTELSGRRILVTGATGGLGSLIARELSAQGAQLVLSARSAESLQALGLDAEMFSVDLLAAGAAQALIDAVTDAGELDGIVIAHGVVAFGPAAEISDETLTTVMTLNQTVPIQLIRAAVPALAASRQAGNEPFILTIAGVVADSPTAGMAVYSASKAGLNAFVSAAQRELRRVGIRVLDARPPHTETGLATRPIAGTAPAMPTGLTPSIVATRIVAAIVNDEKDVPTPAFLPQ